MLYHIMKYKISISIVMVLLISCDSLVLDDDLANPSTEESSLKSDKTIGEHIPTDGVDSMPPASHSDNNPSLQPHHTEDIPIENANYVAPKEIIPIVDGDTIVHSGHSEDISKETQVHRSPYESTDDHEHVDSLAIADVNKDSLDNDDSAALDGTFGDKTDTNSAPIRVDNLINEGTTDTSLEEDLEAKNSSFSPTPASDNIPLREILMQLKPASLLDEEEDERNLFSHATEDPLSADTEVTEDGLASGSVSTIETIATMLNLTSSKNSTGNSSSSFSNKQVLCEQLPTNRLIEDVEIVNASTLQLILENDPEITIRSTEAKCHLVYFFSPYCPFSVAGSAYVNGMAKSLMNIPVYGLDSVEYHSMNARYSVMGTPTLILFHNGVTAGRYNASEYSTSQLMAFINHYTTEKLSFINVTSHDFKATLPSTQQEAHPYILWLAWTFLITCGAWLFLTSAVCAKLTELVLNNWREAEAQHAHED